MLQAMTLFINCADDLFGKITVIRKEGRIVKEIPWTAFALSADDWRRVADARDLLEVRLSHLVVKYSTYLVGRTQTVFNSAFHQRMKPRCGEPCRSSKTCKDVGRKSVMEQRVLSVLQCIAQQSKTGSIRSGSTTTNLTRNRPIFSH
jgi:hypothetical protein